MHVVLFDSEKIRRSQSPKEQKKCTSLNEKLWSVDRTDLSIYLHRNEFLFTISQFYCCICQLDVYLDAALKGLIFQNLFWRHEVVFSDSGIYVVLKRKTKTVHPGLYSISSFALRHSCCKTTQCLVHTLIQSRCASTHQLFFTFHKPVWGTALGVWFVSILF